jgi:autotransporter-associated beta strand protein
VTFAGAVGASKIAGNITVNGAVVNAAAVRIYDGGSLNITNSSASTISGIISGGVNVTKAGAGTLTYTGANTYTGTTTVNAGTLSVGTGGAFANNSSAGITVNDGATLNFARDNVFGIHSASVATPITINAGGTMTNSGGFFSRIDSLTLAGGTLTSTGGMLTTGLEGSFAWALGGTVNVTGNTQSTISGTANVMLGSGTSVTGITFNVGNGAADTDLLVSAKLINSSTNTWGTAQASSLTKTGSGTLTLSGANTYTGGTTISDGTLQVGNALASGVLGSGNVVNNSSLIFSNSEL